MGKKYNFEKDLKRGRFAEELVCDLINQHIFNGDSRSHVLGKKDMPDIVITGVNEISVEVKYDETSGRTGNYFFELLSSRKIPTLGAGLKTSAQLFTIVSPLEERGVYSVSFFHTLELQAYAIKILSGKKPRIVDISNGSSSRGLLLSLSKLIKDLAIGSYVVDLDNRKVLKSSGGLI